MLFRKFLTCTNRKGITLVELIVAITVTAILAVVLSMMIVPVMNTYTVNEIRTKLSLAATSRLDDIADELRGATHVFLNPNKKNENFPDMKNQFFYLEKYQVKYGIALAKSGASALYPELKIANFETKTNEWASVYGLKLPSDDYQIDGVTCASLDDFYFYVRKTPDNPNNTNSKSYAASLEIHLKISMKGVSYEAVKYVVCENLLIEVNKDLYPNDEPEQLYTASVGPNPTPATPIDGLAENKWTKYYAVWYTKERCRLV